MNTPNTAQKLKIVFAGTPDFAATHLQALLTDGKHSVVAVYSQPDRPAGRGKKLTASPVKQLALQHQIPVFQPASLKPADQQQVLAALNADLMVVVAYGLILPTAILNTPKLGCINVHASLLPRWRGAAPIQRAIEAGDTETGITIMQMDEGLDTGDMLLTAACPIDVTDTAATLHDKLAHIGNNALLSAVSGLAEQTLIPEKQDDTLNTYATKLQKAEAQIDWHVPATTLALRIRAFNPFPVTYTFQGNARIKIWRATVENYASNNNQVPGTILQTSKKGLLVKCGEGVLLLEELQLPGKKRLPVSDILNSHAEQFAPGNCFENRASH